MVKQFGALCTLSRGTGLNRDDWDAYGILDRDFVDVRGVESYRPILTICVEDLYEPGQLPNDTYRADAVQVQFDYVVDMGYTIVAYQHDSTGMVALILEKQ